MSDSSSSASGGMGLAGWLTLLFIFLKLNPGGNFTTPIADWSWWWVLSPLWISLGIVVLILLVLLGAWGVAKVLDNRRAKRFRAQRLRRLR